ncbi:MAG: hypothetical protein VB912_00245, partial [Pirellulaceae bacterium]
MRLSALLLALTISLNISCTQSTETSTPEQLSNETTSENQGAQEKAETPATEAKINEPDAPADQEDIPSAAQIAALEQAGAKLARNAAGQIIEV